MRDPFAHEANTTCGRRLADDAGLRVVAKWLSWLRVAATVGALALLAGIWVTWRWL
jgi:hypothetical protein